jgi:hypothetical protein
MFCLHYMTFVSFLQADPKATPEELQNLGATLGLSTADCKEASSEELQAPGKDGSAVGVVIESVPGVNVRYANSGTLC